MQLPLTAKVDTDNFQMAKSALRSFNLGSSLQSQMENIPVFIVYHAVGRLTVGALFSCRTSLQFRLAICERRGRPAQASTVLLAFWSLSQSHRQASSACCPTTEVLANFVMSSLSQDATRGRRCICKITCRFVCLDIHRQEWKSIYF